MPRAARSEEAVSGRLTLLRRVGRILAIGLVVVGSLLTFPAGLPWMIALWLVWHTIQVWRGKPGWLPLATCALIVTAKGTWPTGGLIVLAIAATGSAALGIMRQRKQGPRDRLLIGGSLLALWLAWGVMLVDWQQGVHVSRSREFSGVVRVVCLGDSLTAATTDGGYPAFLKRERWMHVVNLGRDGITTTDALSHLDELAQLHPDVVVIELGGHDFLKGHGRAVAKKNLETMIRTSHGLGAEVLLVEIPRGFLFDPWWGLERQLAREHDVELLPDTVIRMFVLRSPFAPPGPWAAGPYLSDDGLHPNKAGNSLFADWVRRAIFWDLYGGTPVDE